MNYIKILNYVLNGKDCHQVNIMIDIIILVIHSKIFMKIMMIVMFLVMIYYDEFLFIFDI